MIQKLYLGFFSDFIKINLIAFGGIDNYLMAKKDVFDIEINEFAFEIISKYQSQEETLLLGDSFGVKK